MVQIERGSTPANSAGKNEEEHRAEAQIGKENLEVSAIGLGCMRMSAGHGAVAGTKQEMIARDARSSRARHHLLRHRAGLRPFVNEELVGEALAPFRDQVVIATKFGFEFEPTDDRIHGPEQPPENIRQTVEGSLKRLRVETIDLLYQHRVDPECRLKMWPAQ